MGMFKQMKDMKKAVEAAPGLVDQSMQMAAQAQEMAAAQQAAAAQALAGAQAGAPAGATPSGPGMEPVAGVSLEQFAEVSKGLAAYGYDQSHAVQIAMSKGIVPDAWNQAVEGWNARIRTDPAVAQRFNALWRAG